VVGAPSRDNGIGRGAANPVVRVLEGSFTVHRYASDDFITISQHGGAGFSPLRSPHVPGTPCSDFRVSWSMEEAIHGQIGFPA
jgi:hypothetical protein